MSKEKEETMKIFNPNAVRDIGIRDDKAMIEALTDCLIDVMKNYAGKTVSRIPLDMHIAVMIIVEMATARVRVGDDYSLVMDIATTQVNEKMRELAVLMAKQEKEARDGKADN